MIKELKPGEIEELLSSQFVGRIGCYCNGQNYIVPLSYAYDGSYIYIITNEGKKLDMMRKNPGVCFQVDKLEDMTHWKSVISWGVFEELKGLKERKQALDIYMSYTLPFISSIQSHSNPSWPFLNRNTEDIKGVIFRVKLTNKTGRSENNQSSPIL